jgi:hypothetical protein
MTESFTTPPLQSIMEPILSELEGSVTSPLVPDPLNTTQEAKFMLPDNRPHDYRISTTAEDEFECDECCSTRYEITESHATTYAQCLECGFQRPIAGDKSCLNCIHLKADWVGNGFDEPCDYEPECSKWDNMPAEIVDDDEWETVCPQHCGSFEAITPVVDAVIASVGGVG